MNQRSVCRPGDRWLPAALLSAFLATATLVAAQSAPDAELAVLRPEFLDMSCPVQQTPMVAGVAAAPALSPEQQAFRQQRDAYRALIPVYMAYLPAEPDEALLMPVDGVRVSQVTNTYGAPRGANRGHQGQDIFAPRGTPIRSATTGIVFEISDRFTGGRGVMILGPGGVRYFYTHLEAYAEDLREGMAVTPETVIGYVGNDGNAATTPTHLHFGAYAFDARTCRHRAFDPLPLMINR